MPEFGCISRHSFVDNCYINDRFVEARFLIFLCQTQKNKGNDMSLIADHVGLVLLAVLILGFTLAWIGVGRQGWALLLIGLAVMASAFVGTFYMAAGLI
jgi:hypothetical protein